jgi:hypothetical protein
MTIEKSVEMSGRGWAVVTVRAVLPGARAVVLRVHRQMKEVRFYGSATVQGFGCVPSAEWNGFFHDTTSAHVFESIKAALVEVGLSGEAADCLSSYARAGLHDAKCFGLVADFNS